MDTAVHPVESTRTVCNDIRLGIGDYADGYEAFEDLSVLDAISRVWSGWEALGYRVYHGNPVALYLTVLLRNGNVWTGTDVCISHAMAQNLSKSDVAAPQWRNDWQHERPVQVYTEWDTFDASMRAHAVGPDAFDRASPSAEGPLGLAEVVSRFLARRNKWDSPYAPHSRIIDVLMTFPLGHLSSQAREDVETTRMLVGLGGVENLAGLVEDIERDAVGRTYSPASRPSVMHWTA